jgi:hypothetical protein
VIALKHRVKISVLVALTTLAAASGGGFIDSWIMSW